MGQSFSAPQIGRLKTGGGDVWAAFFASGYNPFATTNVGKSIYAVDAYTGKPIATWNFNDVISPVQNPNIETTMPASVTLVDANADGYIDKLYVGDLAGRMWKIDTSKTVTLNSGQLSNQSDYPACVIFDAGNPSQSSRTWAPIITKAAAVVSAGGNVNVYFGTGGSAAAPSNQYYRFYSIRDLDSLGTCTNQVRKDTDLSAANLEWFLADPNQGSKFWSDPTVVQGSSVYFSSYSGDVDSVNPCANLSAGSNVYGIATRNFVGNDGASYTLGKSVLGGGRASLRAQGIIRTAAVPSGTSASQVVRPVANYSSTPTDLYFQQYSGEVLRLSAPGVQTPQPLRPIRWREISF